MKIFFSIYLLFSLLIYGGSFAKDLGYCPKDTLQSCRASLASALNVVTNCALDRPRVKECAFTFIETLSEADHQAPFYEGIYEKNFDVGDVEAYRKEIESLRKYSHRAWFVLHNLSKALILNYIDIRTLTEEQKREIENLIQPVFEITEGRKFDINDDTHRKQFIKKQLEYAKAIEWGAPNEEMVLS